MLPEGFRERILTQKYIDSELLLKSLEEPSPVSIRLNRKKWSAKPVDPEKVPWASNGYYLNFRPSYTLDPLFHAGCYYPQEASSMFLEQVFEQLADKTQELRVLDLCGAPGGKSTHLSSLIGTRGLLVSNEVITTRANILSETLTKWGGTNVIVTQNDPSDFGKLTGYFDIIVVDAPCSGEGMFRTEIARTEWSEANAAHCSERQRRILHDVWPALKENGLLVYSTCTFNPPENEENIKWLTENKNALSVRLDISPFRGITEIDFQGIRGYAFHPGRIKGEGFFIAAVRKNEFSGESGPKVKKTDSLKPTKSETEILGKYFNTDEGRLIKWNDSFIALPCKTEDYLKLKQQFRIIKHGTRLGSFRKENLLPEHDAAMSQIFSRSSFPAVDLAYDEAVAYLRRDTMTIKPTEKGWHVVRYKDVPLGWINNIGTRINNYYPVEWRIRMQKERFAETEIIKWE
jgi:16S rRNA C967 or C1407 C5-methylase (RsmB/RsmF family)/NOL1/NOP2/fmu family ribosome biogenesis protein